MTWPGAKIGEPAGPRFLLCCVTVFIGLIQSRIIAGTYGPVKGSDEHGQTGDIDVSGINVLKYTYQKGQMHVQGRETFPAGTV